MLADVINAGSKLKIKDGVRKGKIAARTLVM